MELLASRFRLLVGVTMVRMAFLIGLVASVALGVGVPLTEVQLTVLETGIQLIQFVTWLVFLSGFSSFLTSARGTTEHPPPSDLVVSYFVPFLNLYRPAQALAAGVQELTRMAGGFRSQDALVYVFWACWIGHSIASRLLGDQVDGPWIAFVVLSFAMLGAELAIAGSIVATAREVGTAFGSREAEGVAEVFR